MVPAGDFVANNCHIIFDSIEEGVFTVDLKWRVTSFNRAAEKITGIAREQAVGRPCVEVFRTNVCQSECVLQRALRDRQPVFNRPVFMTRADSKRIPVTVNASVLKDRRGRRVGGVETFRDLSNLKKLHASFHRHHTFHDMVSSNPKMHEIFELLETMADSDCTVLIEGATGTGKELLARAVHHTSTKRNGPFVPVNCGALPDTLIESELFGYKAGAFTDAKTDKPGRFARAQNGTIFLDEIGDISQAVQVRLLRVLEDKVYEPLGTVTPATTNARIVVASHRNLDRLVQDNLFREDLYFRVNVMKLTLPRLAERKEDIPLLVEHFIARFNVKNSRNVLGLTREAMAALTLYDWPGNIRELENAIEHALVLCKQGLVELRHLPAGVLAKINAAFSGADRGKTLKEIERHAIVEALGRNDWKKARTARELGINKNTLRRKIIGYGLQKP